MQGVSYNSTDRVGERHVYGEFLEKGRHPTARTIDKLVRNDQMAWLNLLPHATHRTHGNDPFYPESLEAIHVGSKINRRRWQTMTAPVARQKHHVASVQGPDDIGIRGRTKWGCHLDLTYVL